MYTHTHIYIYRIYSIYIIDFAVMRVRVCARQGDVATRPPRDGATGGLKNERSGDLRRYNSVALQSFTGVQQLQSRRLGGRGGGEKPGSLSGSPSPLVVSLFRIDTRAITRRGFTCTSRRSESRASRAILPRSAATHGRKRVKASGGRRSSRVPLSSLAL